MKLTAILYEPARDRETTVTEEIEDTESAREGAEFRWTKGNQSCDCNGMDAIAKARGEPRFGVPMPCGESIELRRLDIPPHS